ncbi:MAG: sulfate transporter family protein [Rhizobiaceae bacterium]|nr:sulfate transporter family protein [Rhizobiaceae bacterium]
MIFEAARSAAGHLFSPAFRAVLFKTLGLSLLALTVLWIALRQVFVWLALPFFDGLLPEWVGSGGWFDLVATILAGLAIAAGLALLIAPVTAIIAGIFLDDVAERVERQEYPADPPGRAVPTLASIVLAMKFFLVVVLGNIVALLLLLIPGVNIAAFFVVNGYLIGREFFEFAAMRFRPEDEAKAMRRRNAGTVFLAGLVIAAFMAVPLLNLVSPLFACAMMVHLHKKVEAAERRRPQRAGLNSV